MGVRVKSVRVIGSAGVAALLLATSNGASADDNDAVAFDYASPNAPLIIVEARIGKARHKATVVVDTGGTAPFDVFLSQAAAKRQKLTLSDSVLPPETTAVGPRPQSFRTGTLDSFVLGPVVIGPTSVAIVPMIDDMRAVAGRPVDAIVGQKFLSRQVFSIDYAARKLDLTATPGPDAAAIGFSMAAKKPLILVEVMLNGTGPFKLQIDTGATASTLSPKAAERAGVAVQGHGVQTGAGGAVQVGVGQVRAAFGGIERPLERIAISEAMTGISAAAGTPIDGILGLDFFKGSRLTIDYPNQRLWLAASTPR